MQVRTVRTGANTEKWEMSQIMDRHPFNNALGHPSTADEPTVYTVREVARILRLGKLSVYQAIEKGEVPCIRIGRRILIPRHALLRLLENVRSVSETDRRKLLPYSE